MNMKIWLYLNQRTENKNFFKTCLIQFAPNRVRTIVFLWLHRTLRECSKAIVWSNECLNELQQTKGRVHTASPVSKNGTRTIRGKMCICVIGHTFPTGRELLAETLILRLGTIFMPTYAAERNSWIFRPTYQDLFVFSIFPEMTSSRLT